MRVAVHSIDAFLTELRDASDAGRPLMGDTVRWRTIRTPMQKEGVSFGIGVVGTALVGANSEDDPGFYLLEFAVELGIDSKNNPALFNEAEAMKARVADLCHEAGWKLRDGKWEI